VVESTLQVAPNRLELGEAKEIFKLVEATSHVAPNCSFYCAVSQTTSVSQITSLFLVKCALVGQMSCR
jgi:hypothetical protein